MILFNSIRVIDSLSNYGINSKSRSINITEQNKASFGLKIIYCPDNRFIRFEKDLEQILGNRMLKIFDVHQRFITRKMFTGHA